MRKNVGLLLLIVLFLVVTGCEVRSDVIYEKTFVSANKSFRTDANKIKINNRYHDYDHYYDYHHGGNGYDGCHRNAREEIICFREEVIHLMDQYKYPVEHANVYLEHRRTGTITKDFKTVQGGKIHVSSYLCGMNDVKLLQVPHDLHGNKFKTGSDKKVASIDFCLDRKKTYAINVRRRHYHHNW